MTPLYLQSTPWPHTWKMLANRSVKYSSALFLVFLNPHISFRFWPWTVPCIVFVNVCDVKITLERWCLSFLGVARGFPLVWLHPLWAAHVQRSYSPRAGSRNRFNQHHHGNCSQNSLLHRYNAIKQVSWVRLALRRRTFGYYCININM